MPKPANQLADLLAARIAADGPMSVAEFMAQALGHPEFGYYMKQDPLGAAGDFTTAPEISQMFGELVGLWCANTWLALGRPTPFTLAELGPGRGTLMSDALRALDTVPACRGAVRVHLVETSPALRERQREALTGIDVTWHSSVDDLPMAPTLFIANEFFDALPVEQYICHGGSWFARAIGIAPEESGEPRFVFTLAYTSCPADALPPAAIATATEGAIVEVSPAAQEIVAEIARRIRSHTGAALIIDYGHAHSAIGETLQAVHHHEYADVLANPGDADLTAHVDFGELARAAQAGGAACWGAIEQGEFLRRLGIEARAEKLVENATLEQRSDLHAALARLIDAEQMGTLFKVLAICPAGAPMPAGFLPKEANVS